MTIVNIEDIEEVILAKHKIDVDKIKSGERKEKLSLDEFYNNYIKINYSYIFYDKETKKQETICFGINEINDTEYLFTNNIKYIDKLKKVIYNTLSLHKLQEYKMEDVILNITKDNFEAIIDLQANKYYKC